MNLAQKIAVSVTLLAVAVFLFTGGHRYGYGHRMMSPLRTLFDAVGILAAGGAVIFLLGIRHKRA